MAKISKMQIIHWSQIGAVVPFKDAKGRGARRVYSWQNLLEILICRELNKLTVEAHVMAIVLHWLRNSYDPDTLITLPKKAKPQASRKSSHTFKFSGVIKDPRSYWEMLQEKPDTKHVYLFLYTLEKPEIHPEGYWTDEPEKYWMAGVTEVKDVGPLASTKKSIVFINIRKLIEEVEGA